MEAKNGKIDIIPAIFKTPEREKDLIFTRAWDEDCYAVVTMSGKKLNGKASKAWNLIQAGI